MYRKSLPLILVLLACVALNAGEPWKDKTWKEWDARDVQAILSDSPWAKTVSTVIASANASPPTSQTSSVTLSRPVTSDAQSPPVVVQAPSVSTGPLPTFTHNQCVVMWLSARTMREAHARQAVLQGSPEAQVERLLSKPVTSHNIGITCYPTGRFSNLDENDLKRNSFLRSKTTKLTLHPSRVTLATTGGPTVPVLILHFPLKSESGVPLVAEGEKGIEFECQVGALTLRATFEPAKMVSKVGPDL